MRGDSGEGGLTDTYGIYDDGDRHGDERQRRQQRVYFTPDEGATYYVSAGAYGR